MTPHDEAMRRAAEHHRAGRLPEAEQIYRQVLDRDPRHAAALHLLGVIAYQVRRYDDAIATIQNAVALDPRQAMFHCNLGEAYRATGRIAEAKQCYHEALRLQPTLAAAWNNLGLAVQVEGDVVVAAGHFREAIRLQVDYGDAHYNLSRVFLLQGEFQQAWREYPWTTSTRGQSGPRLNVPYWDGAPFSGTLLVHAEQGLGDTLHFIRYLPLVQARAARVFVQVPAPIIPLLAQSGFEGLLPQGEPAPPCDAQVALGALPAVFGTTLDSIPADVPYLRAEAGLVAEWQQKLASVEGRRIGIAWQGNPAYTGDRWRSIPLREFAPLAAVPGVRLVSLQKNFGTEQIAGAACGFHVHTLGDEVDARGPFLDTAAIMRNLDLVITSDTSIAHLAGALGVPVWVALTVGPDWRWLLDRGDSPWYPTMRLWRQTRFGEWGDVFERMAKALAQGEY